MKLQIVEKLPGFFEINFHNRPQALLLTPKFHQPGTTFFTSQEFSQQVGYMSHPQGKSIAAHRHLKVSREVLNTQEVLVLKKGKLRTDFYSLEEDYLGSVEVNAGDTILLIEGGHGFQILEDVDMIEIKQGPFITQTDKVRFEGVDEKQVKTWSQ